MVEVMCDVEMKLHDIAMSYIQIKISKKQVMILPNRGITVLFVI